MKFFASIFLALSFLSASAADFYVSESGAGTQSGANEANAHSHAWLNGGWGSIVPGSVVHICGVWTNALSFGRQGLDNNPVTYVGEAGSKFSRDTWAAYSYQAAISVDGYGIGLIFTNLTFECVSNGSPGFFAQSGGSFGIYVNQTASNVKIVNCTFTNLYQRKTNLAYTVDAGGKSSWDYATNGAGMAAYFAGGGHDLTIANCKSYQSGNHFFLNYLTGNSNYFVFSNTVVGYSVGINVGNANSTASMSNVQVYANDISDAATWGGAPDYFSNPPTNTLLVSGIHCDGIHLYAAHDNARIFNLSAFGNYFHGDPGLQSTAYLYLEGRIMQPKIYNNLFVDDGPGAPAVAFLDLKGCSNALVANNTFISKNGAAGTAIGLQFWFTDEFATVTNNLIYGTGYAIYETDSGMTRAADYNSYFPPGIAWKRLGSEQGWTGWTNSVGTLDRHGATNNPGMNFTTYLPTNGLIGVSLTNLFTTDFNGATRTNWLAGAFETSGGFTNGSGGGGAPGGGSNTNALWFFGTY